MKRFLVLLLLLGCGEEPVDVYTTSCPEVELGEHIGYLSIEGVNDEIFGYWGCVGEDCSGVYVNQYGVRVDTMGEDVLKVCCGVSDSRVDEVKVVVIK